MGDLVQIFEAVAWAERSRIATKGALSRQIKQLSSQEIRKHCTHSRGCVRRIIDSTSNLVLIKKI